MEWVITRTPPSLKHGGWKTTFLLGFGNFSGAIFHHPIIGGEDFHFDAYFSDGWFNHQPVFKYEFFQVSSPDVLKKTKSTAFSMVKPCHTKPPAPETWTPNHQTNNPPAESLKTRVFVTPLGGGTKKICTNLMAGLSSTPNGVLLWLKVGEGAATAATAPGKLIVYIYIDIYIYIPTRKLTWLAGKSTMNELMYFLLNMGIFQPVMLVFRGVYMEWK